MNAMPKYIVAAFIVCTQQILCGADSTAIAAETLVEMSKAPTTDEVFISAMQDLVRTAGNTAYYCANRYLPYSAPDKAKTKYQEIVFFQNLPIYRKYKQTQPLSRDFKSLEEQLEIL